MAKLNQIIAVVGGRKSRVQSALTQVYHSLQKNDLLSGLKRTYRPKDEEGEKLPEESKRVQVRVSEQLETVRSELTDLFDGVATMESANAEAKADVKVGSKVILSAVPVTVLLFLEKQLTDIGTLVSKLPTLDPAERWEKSAEADCFATATYESVRTKKIPRNHVKYEATKEHPAQVEMYMEDVLVGFWSTVKFSGAIPEAERNSMMARVRQLQDAVKVAREEANGIDVKDVKIAKPVFDFLFSESTV